jgi:hypothetical protein
MAALLRHFQSEADNSASMLDATGWQEARGRLCQEQTEFGTANPHPQRLKVRACTLS